MLKKTIAKQDTGITNDEIRAQLALLTERMLQFVGDDADVDFLTDVIQDLKATMVEALLKGWKIHFESKGLKNSTIKILLAKKEKDINDELQKCLDKFNPKISDEAYLAGLESAKEDQ